MDWRQGEQAAERRQYQNVTEVRLIGRVAQGDEPIPRGEIPWAYSEEADLLSDTFLCITVVAIAQKSFDRSTIRACAKPGAASDSVTPSFG